MLITAINLMQYIDEAETVHPGLTLRK